MELVAGADAFDDLLAEIATFAEMERLALVGFLRKEAVCDVFAVARFTVFEAHDSSGFGVRLFDSKLRDERRLFVDRGEDEESGRSGGTETSDKPRAAGHEGVVRFGNRIFLQFDCDILFVYADIVWFWRPIVYR